MLAAVTVSLLQAVVCRIIFCRIGKSPRECVSLAIDDCVQSQFSSQVECFVDFSLVCRNDSSGRLKRCCFYVLGKKNINVKHK